MLQLLSGRGGRCAPRELLMPVAVALLILCGPGSASPQSAPATAPQATPQIAPQTAPPATGAKPDESAPQAPGEKGPPGGRGRGGRSVPPPPPLGAEPTDLEETMHWIKDHTKAMSVALGSSNSEAALAEVGEIERLVLIARKFGPNNMKQIAEADRPAHQVAYRKALLGLLKELVDVEINVLDGKFDVALEQLKGPLAEMRDDAHDKFQAKRERR